MRRLTIKEFAAGFVFVLFILLIWPQSAKSEEKNSVIKTEDHTWSVAYDETVIAYSNYCVSCQRSLKIKTRACFIYLGGSMCETHFLAAIGQKKFKEDSQ